jgi:hypothetical protein
MVKDAKMKIGDSFPILFTFPKGAMARTGGRASIAVIIYAAGPGNNPTVV